ncbi:MAG: REP-associated tyrosine transposase [Tepidisphaerales bacterium]
MAAIGDRGYRAGLANVAAMGHRGGSGHLHTCVPYGKLRLPMPHKHLHRLDRTWAENPVFFITTCVDRRREILASDAVFGILRGELAGAWERHGWRVGRFVVMPDHLHFFCSPAASGDGRSLSRFVQQFKQWSCKRIIREAALPDMAWQREFFDHLLRSEESYHEKAEYMFMNPVRAGLVGWPEHWPYGGDIGGL